MDDRAIVGEQGATGGESPEGTSDAAEAMRIFREVEADAADVPRATYRVQLHGGFTFAEAHERIAYMAALGVSHLYSSPFFKARPGSNHGYDLVDHNTVNPEIGTREDLDRLTAELREHEMGMVLDFVPNHMGIGTSDNTWWLDVLENGPSSLYAPYFDIDWAPVKPELRNKVLLPVLGDHYGRVLERGELKVAFEGGAFFLRYYEHSFPLNPRTYTLILEPVVNVVAAELGDEHDTVLELQSVITGLRNLPTRTETRRARVIERRREKEILKRRLAAVIADVPHVERALGAELERLSGKPGDRRSFDPLGLILEEQAYRLSFWRTAAEEINYRRFFDINDLAAIHMENPAVFSAAHRLIFDLCAEGLITGLRIDHPDGLWDPSGYFASLQRGYFLARCRGRLLAAQGKTQDERAAREAFDRLEPHFRALFDARIAEGPRSPLALPLYLVAEKILSRGETLPEDWPLHGTSGYEFARAAGALFVDGQSEAAMTAVYERFIGERFDFDTLVYDKKKLILKSALASELNVLSHALNRLTERDRRYRDFTLGSLTDTLREVIACFPVYRTYINERTTTLSDHDRVAIHRAIGLARRRNPTTEGSVFSFLRAVLTLELPDEHAIEDRPLFRDFVMRFQQLTGPVMAKGLEDTSFYIYNRLVSLNEVGGEPERYGLSIPAFHRENAMRQRAWPCSMLATTTHDTKRGEDVRARISVLSELVEPWEAALTAAGQAASGLKGEVDGEHAPDRNDEYLLYQTLLGTLPLDVLLGGDAPRVPEGEALAGYVERIVAYMRKATKEAKVNTSWIEPNADYDAAVERFVRQVITPGPVLEALLPLARTVAYHGMWGALSQALLKLTSPGVPDIYQGQEWWDFSLVDPDNRRPVDYDVRVRALAEIRERRGEGAAFARELVQTAADGRIKLLVTHVALLARQEAQLFGPAGAYVPIMAAGTRADHAVAFARRTSGREIVVVAPRLTAKLMEGRCEPPIGAAWQGTWLPAEPGAVYTDLFTGAEVRAGDPPADAGTQEGSALRLERVLADFPLALLARDIAS